MASSNFQSGGALSQFSESPAFQGSDRTTVALTTSSQNELSYTVTAFNVKDTAGNGWQIDTSFRVRAAAVPLPPQVGPAAGLILGLGGVVAARASGRRRRSARLA